MVSSSERLDVGETRGAALPPDWALQVPHDYVDVLQVAVPAAVRESGIDPQRRDRDRHRLHRVHGAARARRRHAAVRGARVGRLARTPTSSSGSTTRRRPTPTGSTPSPPSAASRGWRRYGGQHLVGVGVRQGSATAWRRIPRSTGGPCTGSRPPTGSCGSSPASTSATRARPATRRSARTAPTRPASSSRHSTRTSPTSSSTRSSARSPSSAHRVGSLTPTAARWTGLPDGIAVCAGNVDAHVTAPAAQAIEPGQMVAIMGTSTCHVMSSDMLREVPGMCGVVDGGIVPGLWGYEAGQSGVGDIFALVRRQPGPGELRARRGRCRPERARAPHQLWPRRSRSAATDWWRSTGTAGTARCSSTTSCPVSSSG